jgi:hypothetical protein
MAAAVMEGVVEDSGEAVAVSAADMGAFAAATADMDIAVLDTALVLD